MVFSVIFQETTEKNRQKQDGGENMGGRNVKKKLRSMFVVIFQDVRQAAWQRRLLIRRGSRVSLPHQPRILQNQELPLKREFFLVKFRHFFYLRQT